jgi:uncharacterized membrane protein
VSERQPPPARAAAVPAEPPDSPAPIESLEVALAHVLQLGTYVSVALIVVGSVLLIAGGTSPTAGGPPFAVERLAADVIALRPEGFLWLGIVGILATPGLRVVRALLGFLRRAERGMAWIATLVLVVIAAGVIVGVMAR